MTDAEREEHFRSGKCFTCHQTGHRSKNCPKKARDARKNYKGKQLVRQLPEEEAKEEDSEGDKDRFEEVDEEATEVKRMQDF
jgi:collagenase-like PrtC family protease